MAVALGLIALIVLLLLPGGWDGQPAPVAQATAAQATAAPTSLAVAGRGRTTATEVPAVRPPPTTLPTATTVPVAVASGAPGAGVGAQTGAGVLPPIPPGDDRFIFQVLDAQTGRGVEGVCVAYGGDCDKRRTNAQGIWWIDFPRGGALADKWRFDFVSPGYRPETKEVRYVPGETNPTVAVFLRRAT